MPRPKKAKTERTCLVCGGTTNVAHLGLDICRACTVFYRRSRDRKYACRSNTNNCPIGEGVNCRKCRLAEMKRMLSEKQRTAEVERASTSSPGEEIKEEEELDQVLHDSPHCSPSTSASVQPSCECDSENPHPRELLEKLRHCYRAMCNTRLAGELNSRKDPPNPLAIVDGTYAIVPATLGEMDKANRVYLTALLQFGSAVFPEFSEFNAKQRWTIVTNFFTRYRMFETTYRADKAFVDDMTKSFAGYTMYVAADITERYFDDCANETAFVEEAKQTMEAHIRRNLRGTRVHMRRLNLVHEEFLAVLAIMFWTTEGLDISEEVSRASRLYKEQILKEIHSYYREELQLSNYASRLGELLMTLQVYEQRSAGLDQHIEMMRLLNVFDDNTLVYTLHAPR